MTNYSYKILVTGGQGQLAQALQRHPFGKNFQLLFCSRADMDITNIPAILTTLQQFPADLVVNTAAYTAVDKAESEESSALAVNHLGAKNLAEVCQQLSIPLIHLSTDYVFNGEKQMPYLEDDITSPLNIYGKSKLLGEDAVRQYCEQHYILRVSGVYSQFDNNFFKTMLRLGQEKKEMRIVADQITCPTDANDIARVIFTMIPTCIKKRSQGIYHYCGGTELSWHEFAVKIFAEAKKYKPFAVETIQAITATDYPTAAKRPAYSVLSCQKIKSDFDIIQTSLETSLQEVTAKFLQRL